MPTARFLDNIREACHVAMLISTFPCTLALRHSTARMEGCRLLTPPPPPMPTFPCPQPSSSPHLPLEGRSALSALNLWPIENDGWASVSLTPRFLIRPPRHQVCRGCSFRQVITAAPGGTGSGSSLPLLPVKQEIVACGLLPLPTS